MGKAGGPEHSAAIKRGLARAKARFDRKAPERARVPRRCERCGDPITESYTGRRKLRYCSTACRQAAYRDRKAYREKYLKEHPYRCWQCDTPVAQPDTGRWREYCSDACRQAAYRYRKWLR